MAATVEIAPNKGPQAQAFSCAADILIYGGGAGGGKSWMLIAEPLRHMEVKGFTGAIFRRTYPQITGQGGIWDEARKLYPLFGGRMREGSELDVRFGSGASIAFCHLQHEKTKYEYMGHQICYLGFDELTHFTETQFWYMLSRNRSNCGVTPYVRATCNPDAGSWVADFISWWIDQDTGLAIPERCGVLRYFVRTDVGEGDQLFWADTKEELIAQFPEFELDQILSVSFIAATVTDNPHLDKAYVAKLKAMPRIERERLLGCNWKSREGSLIDSEWLKSYSINEGRIEFVHQGVSYSLEQAKFKRFAIVDTAGTSKEKAAELRGDPPSWSVCLVVDWLHNHACAPNGVRTVLKDLLFIRHVWRAQVDWNSLKADVPAVLDAWDVPKCYIENAHYGKPLKSEIKCCSVELVAPVISGMDDSSRGAKLERAVASGMLSRVENGLIFLPSDSPTWLAAYKRELTIWTGLPKETADQIDVTSYACYVSRRQMQSWGGPIQTGNGRLRA